jgi:hypothetical protein
MSYGPGWLAAQVVAVHGHVQCAHRHPDAFDFVHHCREPMSQCDTAGGDSHQGQALGAAIRLQDLMGHPSAGTGNLIGIQDYPRRRRIDLDARRRVLRPGLWRAGT